MSQTRLEYWRFDSHVQKLIAAMLGRSNGTNKKL